MRLAFMAPAEGSLARRLPGARWWASSCLSVAVLSGAARAAAAPRGVDEVVELAWNAPAGCPDGAYVERQLAGLLGESPPDTPTIRARADVTREENGAWKVELATSVGESSGHRVIAAESCRAVADAVALVLALAIDPEAGSANRAAPASPPPAATPAIPEAPPSPPERPAFEDMRPVPSVASAHRERPLAPAGPPRASGAAFSLRTYVFGDVGTLPYPTPGVGAIVSASPASIAMLRFELGGALSAMQSTGAAPLGGRFWLRALETDVCLVPAVSHWDGGVCAGAELESLAASGVGEVAPRSEHGDWLSIRVRATGAYRWASTWAIRADLGAGMGVNVPSFVALGTPNTLIYRPSTLTGRGGVGLEARF